MSKNLKKVKFPINRIFAVMILDAFSIMLASFMSLYIRFDFSFSKIEPGYLENLPILITFNIISTYILYWIFKLYVSVWRYAGSNEFINIVLASTIAAVAQYGFAFAFSVDMPRSFYANYWAFLMLLTTGIRFSYRAMRILSAKHSEHANKKGKINVMIIGAGAAANSIIKEIESSNYIALNVCCIVDDGEGCQGKFLRGIPIVGKRDSIPEKVAEYNINEIIFAIPSATAKVKREILDICTGTGCTLRTLPGIYQLINGDVAVSKLRDVEIEDLLGREPIRIDNEEVFENLTGKTIMVTGGGGSIGSELCRQIATHDPKNLIIVDIYENNAYEIQQELIRKYPYLNLTVLIASVRNTLRMEKIFETYRPEVVFHAAAHKHVPLMETSPNEAIKNNVFGTYKTAKAADKYGAEKFILISTDKAVNPTNIMGASKRICEMVVQMMNEKSKTSFVAVRFGNVLGSNGSVIPLFKKQIAEGGPVTVTDPNIIRYFMTIPEAVSLVLQASVFAKGGEIFVLDMGEPVKILDLAKNLIKLSGYKVGEDIDIKFTGLRPGEKMYEELLMSEEGLKKTSNEMIFIGKPIEFSVAEFEKQLAKLEEDAKNEDADIRADVKEIVSTYSYSIKKK